MRSLYLWPHSPDHFSGSGQRRIHPLHYPYVTPRTTPTPNATTQCCLGFGYIVSYNNLGSERKSLNGYIRYIIRVYFAVFFCAFFFLPGLAARRVLWRRHPRHSCCLAVSSCHGCENLNSTYSQTLLTRSPRQIRRNQRYLQSPIVGARPIS